MPNLLILDVDGVLTDGTKTYDQNGQVISKRFCDHDFTAIKKFQADGWHVCLLSADECVNKPLARARGINFHYSRDKDGVIDKVQWLGKLVDIYSVKNISNVTYVGDDLFDLPIMEAVVHGMGHIFCPSSAVPQVIEYCSVAQNPSGVLSRRGGEGAIMEMYTRFSNSAVPPCT